MPQFVYLVDCEINRMQKLEKFLLLRCQRVIKFLWQIVLGKEWGKDYIREGAETVGIRSEKKEKGGKITRRQLGQTKTRFQCYWFKFMTSMSKISLVSFYPKWHIQTSCGLPILLFQSFSDWIFLQKPLTHIFSNFSSRFALCIISDPIQIDGISKRPQKRSKTQQLLEIWGLFGRTRKRNKTRRVV